MCGDRNSCSHPRLVSKDKHFSWLMQLFPTFSSCIPLNQPPLILFENNASHSSQSIICLSFSLIYVIILPYTVKSVKHCPEHGVLTNMRSCLHHVRLQSHVRVICEWGLWQTTTLNQGGGLKFKTLLVLFLSSPLLRVHIDRSIVYLLAPHSNAHFAPVHP